MERIRRAGRRLKWLFRRNDFDRQLEEEMRFHLEMAAHANAEAGMTADEARYAARRQFGNPTLLKETSHETYGWRWLETLAQDVRYAVRGMRNNPGFSAVAVLSLGLGIGANTAIFYLMNAALLESLPVKRPEELVQVVSVFRDGARVSNVDYRVFQYVHGATQSFSGLFASVEDEYNLRVEGHVERVSGQRVSGSYYTTLGVQAVVGRTITEEDDVRPGGNPVVVLSHPFWKRRFGLEPSVVGKTVYLNGSPFTIIGVTPPQFYGLDRLLPTDITVPMATQADPYWVWITGRLRPGVSVHQARAELEAPFQQAIDGYSHSAKSWSARDRQNFFSQKVDLDRAGKGLRFLRAALDEPIQILTIVVGIVLLIACANVANLLLARSAARSKEIGLRRVVGAGRNRILRQLLTESLLLALIGGALGLLLAAWGSRLFVTLLLPFSDWAYLDFRPSYRILAFNMAVSLGAALVFGLAPALRATRVDLHLALKGTSGNASGRTRVGPARGLLVAQVAASLVLLVTAGLFLRTLRTLKTLDPGFDSENLLLMRIDPERSGYTGARAIALSKELTARIQAIPGVRSASVSSNVLFGIGGWKKTLWVQGYDYAPGEDQMVAFNAVGSRFFETAGIPLLAGREFDERDLSPSPRSAVINQAMARKYFGNDNPIRRLFRDSANNYEIVGVVGNAKYGSLRERTYPVVYQPLAAETGSIVLHVRTIGDPAAMISRIRREIAAIDKDLPVYGVRTLADQVSQSLHRERMFATLTSLFGALALVLACVGLYGVMAYTVTRRTGEIGIRMALGARCGDVLKLVLGQAAGVVAAGLAIGVAVAWGVTRFAASQFYGVSAADPMTFVAVSVLLATVALAASYVPARRASRVDPMAVLRYD